MREEEFCLVRRSRKETRDWEEREVRRTIRDNSLKEVHKNAHKLQPLYHRKYYPKNC